MNCDTLTPPSDLSYTGFPLAAVLTLGGGCLLGGVLLLVLARNRRGRTAALAVALLLLSAALSASSPGESSAEPTNASCITITQTSPLTGLAPGIAPAAITGKITNHWADTIFVTTVTVSIASVTKAPGSRDGTCDASDFLLARPGMPVGVTIEPGGSADVTGASIGFNNKSVNQDACQGATVELHYLSA